MAVTAKDVARKGLTVAEKLIHYGFTGMDFAAKCGTGLVKAGVKVIPNLAAEFSGHEGKNVVGDTLTDGLFKVADKGVNSFVKGSQEINHKLFENIRSRI